MTFFLPKIESDQGSFGLQVIPFKAHFRSGAAVGRSRDLFADREGQPIETHTVLLGFLKVAQNGAGWAGSHRTGLAGLGLQTVSQQSGCSFRHPAAAARSCGSGQWGRSQTLETISSPCEVPAGHDTPRRRPSGRAQVQRAGFCVRYLCANKDPCTTWNHVKPSRTI